MKHKHDDFKKTLQEDTSRGHFKKTLQEDTSKRHFKRTLQEDTSNCLLSGFIIVMIINHMKTRVRKCVNPRPWKNNITLRSNHTP